MQERQDWDRWCVADPDWYELPERMDDRRSRFAEASTAPPAGWQRFDHGLWVTLAPRGARLPSQYWKIHVSSAAATAAALLARVHTWCVGAGLPFRFLRSGQALAVCNGADADPTTSGRFITVYPDGTAQLTRIVEELGPRVAGFPGPAVLGDLRLGDGPLHARYGAIHTGYGTDADGEPVALLRSPDGHQVPEHRLQRFLLPAWVRLPAVLAAHLPAPPSAAADGPAGYRIGRHLRVRNSGSVHLATHRPTGRTVVVKQARPHTAVDATGADAMARSLRERDALRRCAGLACVPRVLDDLTAGGNHVLVVEHVPGSTLRRQVLDRHALLEPQPTGGRLTGYLAWVDRTVHQVAAAVRTVHGRGVCHNGLHPGTILLAPADRVVLLDFELATDAARGAAPSGRATDADWHALLRTWLFMLLPVAATGTDPRGFDRLLDQVLQIFPTAARGLPPELAALIGQATVRRAGHHHPVPSFGDPEPDLAALRTSICSAILASATPQRHDRLFPADPDVFRYGGHTLANGAAGVLLAMHAAGEPVFRAHTDWLARTATDPATRPGGGLLHGRYGTAVALDAVGRPDEAFEVLLAARAEPLPTPPGLGNGRAGVLLGLLHFATAHHDDELLDAAVRLGDRLAAEVDAAVWPGPGLVRGPSGAALALAALAAATGDRRHLAAALRYLDRDLARCVPRPSGQLLVDDGSRELVCLERGSAGVAVAAAQLLRQAPTERLAAAVRGLRLACLRPLLPEPGLLRGRAGLVVALCVTDPDGTRAGVAGHMHRFGWHAVTRGSGTVFPGTRLRRLSTDLATGSAGVLLAMSIADRNRPVAVLPCLDRPPPAGACLDRPPPVEARPDRPPPVGAGSAVSACLGRSPAPAP